MAAPAYAQPGPSGHKEALTTLFQLLSPDETGVRFADIITENELLNGVNNINSYNGSGVAAGDINGDGLPDLFFCATSVGNRLYINKGNFTFEDATERSGLADSGYIRRGAVMVDIDADGDLDLYVCRIEAPNKLYLNDGRGNFTDRAKEFGLDASDFSTQANFFDYDGDGDLDMYLAVNGRTVDGSWTRSGNPDRLYRNNGNNSFTDVSTQAGIADTAYAHSVTISDLNGDGRPDIFVANDFEARDICYINNGNGTFTDKVGSMLRHYSTSTMGSDIADYNNDGLPDIFSLDMIPEDHVRELALSQSLSVLSPIFDSAQVPRNMLQLNRGGGIFSEIAQLAGISSTDWSWAVLVADFDNDGLKDAFVANGIKRDLTSRDASYRVMLVEPGDEVYTNPTETQLRQRMLKVAQRYPSVPVPNYGFRNNGDLTFSNVSDAWGLDQPSFSHGSVYIDLDLDGDLDLVTNNVDAPAFIYRNMAREEGRGNYLRVQLEGMGKNPAAYGARVSIRTGDRQQMLEHYPVRGYLGSVDQTLHFGLGAASSVDEITVRWPDGKVQTVKNIAANQTLKLSQKNAAGSREKAKAARGLFALADTAKTIAYRHRENIFDDLKRERILPRRLSQNGPGMAVGDVNADGLDDIFIGGALGEAGALFIQQSNGRFLRSSDSAIFRADAASEDMGAIFFDADGDRDLDLYVVSGGNETPEGAAPLQDRLYINNGKGVFSKSANAIPADATSGSCVVAGDYDRDGDLDLFVGGRLVPGKYPMPTRSYILRNDGGRFSDVTEQVAPELMKAGMVCAAIWSDHDNDGDLDLLIAGEWMPVRVLDNNGGRFATRQNTGIDSASGWWNSLVAGDFDNDGDIDYVAGNLGHNWRYRASPEYPIEMYSFDFDGNGSLDGVLAYNDRKYGKLFPVVDRDRMSMQIPSTQAKFNTFTSYAQATIQEMYPAEKLKAAYHTTVNRFTTSYIENLGGGRFAMHDLPLMAQLSPTFGLLADDYNADGNLDLFMSGNFYDGPEPMLTRYDASCGLVMLGDGKGGFTPLTPEQSGVVARADARGAAAVRIGKGGNSALCNMVLNNGGWVQSFRLEGNSGKMRFFTLDPSVTATHGVLAMKDGTKRRHEFSVGSGYLTQNSQTIVIPASAASLTLFNGDQQVKSVTF